MSLKQQYEDKGFVIVPDLISDKDREELEQACDLVISRTRSGDWPHRRVVGKQFPPYGSEGPDSWGVQHVLNPELGGAATAFAKWYTSDAVRGVVKELLACDDQHLQMELFNLLINPLSHEFALRWHRDDVRENAMEEEEREALSVWHWGVQWNTALYEDSCLYVVPGSHKQPRTPEQRQHSSTMDPPKDPMDMPGAIQVTLKPGESVFYNQNILHCATYHPRARRATLHACMGDTRGGSVRARNVLQHGLEWMTEDEFRAQLDPMGKAMLERLIKMKEDVNGEVGYSLSN